MNALVRAGFALLVAATFGAFFVAQRLKHEPTVVQPHKGRFFHPAAFSPGPDMYQRRVAITFNLKRRDDVTVSIADADTGDVVRHLPGVANQAPHRTVLRHWDGREDDRTIAPDGAYRVLVGLRGEGRSVTLPGRILLDTTPPAVEVAGVSAPIIAAGASHRVRVKFHASTRHTPYLLVIRTDVARPLVVARIRGRVGHHAIDWDGRVRGGPAPAGTYMMGIESRDSAANFGHYPATLPPTQIATGFPVRLPAAAAGRRPQAGVTVRAVAVAPTKLAAVETGHRVSFLIDGRHQSYTWDVRRVGSSSIRLSGRSSRVQLRLQVPNGISGVDLLELRTPTGRTAIPFAVQAAQPASHHVLVVLPYLSWQGRNPLDPDGDGLPDTLERGGPVPLLRPLGLPSGFIHDEAPLLSWLDRNVLRYDITTDAALALGRGPKLAGHSGVVLAGQPGWSTPALATALRHYVNDGGRVLLMGTDELRRSVRLDVLALSLTQPSSERATDVFGLRYGTTTPLQQGPLTVFTPNDLSGLFSTSGGTFAGLPAYEPLLGTGGGRLLSYAGPAPGRRAIAAVQVGSGLVLRIGVPDWTARLASDAAAATLTRQAWSILSR